MAAFCPMGFVLTIGRHASVTSNLVYINQTAELIPRILCQHVIINEWAKLQVTFHMQLN